MPETELIEMPKGLFDAVKQVLRISQTPGPNGPMVEMICALDQCKVIAPEQPSE